MRGAIYYAVLATVIFSHVKITSPCYFHMWRYQVFARKLTCYFIIVYVINNSILHDIVIIKREQRRKVQNKRKLATTKNCLTLFLIVAWEHALWGALAAGREKEGEFATASLEFECLHRKRWCEIFIGGDDISNDVSTIAMLWYWYGVGEGGKTLFSPF